MGGQSVGSFTPCSTHHSLPTFASWQWANYCFSQIPAGQRALRVNMDETSICLLQGDDCGNIFLSKKAPAAQHAPLRTRRAYLARVALVCDDQLIQLLLPQVIIGNEHSIKASELRSIQASCMPNVRVFRRKSTWVDWRVIVTLAGWLATAVRGFSGGLRLILFFDAGRAHQRPSVFAACASAGIWTVVVPARMTRLLQPLDTRVFLIYKMALQRACQAARIRSASGELDVAGLVRCISECVRNVFHGRCWAYAFDGDGLSPGQSALRERILAELLSEGAVGVRTARPELPQIRLCFPKRSRVPAKSIWRPFDAPAASQAAAPRVAASTSPSAAAATTDVVAAAAGAAAPPPVAPSALLGARPKALA